LQVLLLQDLEGLLWLFQLLVLSFWTEKKNAPGWLRGVVFYGKNYNFVVTLRSSFIRTKQNPHPENRRVRHPNLAPRFTSRPSALLFRYMLSKILLKLNFGSSVGR